MNSKNDQHPKPNSPACGTETRRRISRLSALPPLPQRAQDLVHLLSDPDLDIMVLVELVEQTPALSARLLGVANSAYFGNSVHVQRVSDAIIRVLGLNLGRDLLLSCILGQQFRVEDCRGFDALRFWKHAIMSATLAQSLALSASNCGLADQGWAYLGGLLHSLGILGLVHLDPRSMGEVFERARSNPPASISDLEREILGIDHAQAGAVIGAAWNLPEQIITVMAKHRDLQYRGSYWPLVALVALADRVSSNQLSRGQNTDEHGLVDETILLHVLTILGMTLETWQHTYLRWVPQVERVEQLAAAFTRSLP